MDIKKTTQSGRYSPLWRLMSDQRFSTGIEIVSSRSRGKVTWSDYAGYHMISPAVGSTIARYKLKSTKTTIVSDFTSLPHIIGPITSYKGS